MSEAQTMKFEVAIRRAVETAIKQVGFGTLKATSLFMSNNRKALKKAA